MPEAWDANTGASMNHCVLGHIQEWFMGWIAGIRPDPAAPGFRRFVIDPHPVGDLRWARAIFESVRGRIVSDWKKTAGRFALEVTIPPNTSATVFLPEPALAEIQEGGRTVDRARGVRVMQREPERAVLRLDAGRYRFSLAAGP